MALGGYMFKNSKSSQAFGKALNTFGMVLLIIIALPIYVLLELCKMEKRR